MKLYFFGKKKIPERYLAHVVLHVENIVQVCIIGKTHLLSGLASIYAEVVGIGAGGRHGEDLACQKSQRRKS